MWGTKTKVANALNVAGTEQYSNAITLNPGESCDLQVVPTFPGSDNLLVYLYTTLDDDTEQWDDVPLQYLGRIASSKAARSFVINGFYRGRIGFVREGSTDTIVVNAWMRKDGVNV